MYSWWWDYVHAVVAIMQGDRRPDIDAALEEPFFDCMRSALRCGICDGAAVAYRVLTVTRKALRREIEDRLSSVSIESPQIFTHVLTAQQIPLSIATVS